MRPGRLRREGSAWLPGGGGWSALSYARSRGRVVPTAASAEERGIDPNQGESLVEVNLPDKAAAMRLQLEADKYGIDFNEHYLRQEPTAR